MKTDQILLIKGCTDCIFRYSSYDDYALGYDILDICVLSNNIIKAYDSFTEKREYKLRTFRRTPKWCPLDQKNLIIKKETL